MKKLICKYCGEEFERGRGRITDHCRKEECLRQARNEANRKYYAKKMKNELGKTKVKIIEQKERPTIIYSSKEKAETKIQMTDIGDIIQLAREFGTVRFKLIELLKRTNEEVGKYDKLDQTFLHRLEFLEELSDEEAKQMIIEEKQSRELRRNVKNRRYLIEAMLNSISMKNPNAFIIQAVQSKGDICKTIARLKTDNTLYSVKENINNCNN